MSVSPSTFFSVIRNKANCSKAQNVMNRKNFYSVRNKKTSINTVNVKLIQPSGGEIVTLTKTQKLILITMCFLRGLFFSPPTFQNEVIIHLPEVKIKLYWCHSHQTSSLVTAARESENEDKQKPAEWQISTRKDEKMTKTIKHNMTAEFLQCTPITSKNYQWPTALKTPAGGMNICSTKQPRISCV